MTKRVLLFTAFPPDAGGGSTNLRSILPHLDREVLWAHDSGTDAKFARTVQIGAPLMGGPVARDVIETTALWSGVRTPRFAALVDKVLALGHDAYWVVAHYEATLVARELLRRGKRVHLTIQDDQPDAVFARSRRYRHLTRFARSIFHDVIRSATSVDVTSDGMQRYYAREVGRRDAFVIHPYVHAMPPRASPPAARNDHELVVGHVGIVYSVPQWHGFVEALIEAARRANKKPRMIMVGLAPRYVPHARAYPDVIEVTGVLDEASVVARLAGSDLVYAQYPFGPVDAIFRTTSLPTKLSTYVQCRRPIFAQTPAGSTLAELVDEFRIGRVVDSLDRAVLADAIERVAAEPPPAEAFDRARDEAYGPTNLAKMNGALAKLLA